MTKDEAAAILGVQVTASAADVRRRFEELYNDFQIRLTNAPTPNLKKAYQKNLQDLRAACESLAPGAVADPVPDLPASEPVDDIGVEPMRTRRHPPAVTRAPVSVQAPAEQGLPRSTIIVGVIAVILAAALSFLGLRWFDTQGKLTALQNKADKQEATLKELGVAAAGMTELLQNGQVEVCNRSSKPLRVTAVASVYKDKGGRLRTVHSGFYGWPTWQIQRGGRARLEIVQQQDTVWDGASIFYALEIDYGGDSYLAAGMWRDVKDRCLAVNLD